MNKAFLVGNLTRDPELRTTAGGVSVCTFTLAINRRFTNQEGVREADFINVVAWRQLAEICARYLSKGRKAAVVGTIQTRSYDAQDGTKRHVTEVVADDVEFLSPAGAPQERNEPAAPPPAEPTGGYSGANASGFSDIDDDELPF